MIADFAKCKKKLQTESEEKMLKREFLSRFNKLNADGKSRCIGYADWLLGEYCITGTEEK